MDAKRIDPSKLSVREKLDLLAMSMEAVQKVLVCVCLLEVDRADHTGPGLSAEARRAILKALAEFTHVIIRADLEEAGVLVEEPEKN
jgi:hypothetical protein